MKRNQILVGDVRDRLREIATGSVDCVVSSPPYLGLRDYGHRSQLGTEADIDSWVREVCSVGRQLARVLHPHGSWWLNIADSYSSHPREGAPPKALLLGPQRLAIALAEDGWLIRNQIIWAKSNPMPSSVTDRLSATYETVLLLTRAPRYFFDLDAIRVPAISHRAPQARRAIRGYPPPTAMPATGRVNRNKGLDRMRRKGANAHPLGKSPGDVWTIATANYRGAHFAAYPLPLAERAVLAGCPERVCTRCSTPWRKAKRRDRGGSERLLRTGALAAQCRCEAGWRPGLVLDPFLGSGTTAVAAIAHRRDWLGIELNPDYAAIAQERIGQAGTGPPPTPSREAGG
ncbi:DNA-methyltransferase [Mycolicibacterium sp.]|uniref:DNA-methyltransferase n=1 Tax=Mycolicibacterium sp. TaxID=2320850 RepID=UPI0037CB3A45